MMKYLMDQKAEREAAEKVEWAKKTQKEKDLFKQAGAEYEETSTFKYIKDLIT